MRIDDFIWLPDIVEKLAVKHLLPRTRPKKCSSTSRDIASLNQDVGLVKTCILPADRLTQADT